MNAQLADNLSDYETSDNESNFSTAPKGYHYDPECTDAELQQMELEWTERELGGKRAPSCSAGEVQKCIKNEIKSF